MITYTNIKRYDNLSFEDYLNLDGYSHSFLRHETNGVAHQIEVTEKMKLGSLVDAILTEPHTVNMADPMYNSARNIAFAIKSNYAHILPQFQKQVSYTAEIEYKGFRMLVKGRLDYVIPKVALLDAKVTSAPNFEALITYMGYDNQMWHYARLAEAKSAYLMPYSVPKKTTKIIKIDVSAPVNEFWAEKILKFGNVA